MHPYPYPAQWFERRAAELRLVRTHVPCALVLAVAVGAVLCRAAGWI